MTGWTDERPMSPHLQVWKWHWTMAASIFHRASGVANYIGAALIAAWLAAAASGREMYNLVEDIIASAPGQLVLFGFTVSVLYHLANGIRHLVWDGPGSGFNPSTASLVSVFNMAFGLFGAIALWALAWL
ncbi:MAG: succinate dehydrogenase, cytochrome b556 subunit [Pseudomonadota bacterium]